MSGACAAVDEEKVAHPSTFRPGSAASTVSTTCIADAESTAFCRHAWQAKFPTKSPQNVPQSCPALPAYHRTVGRTQFEDEVEPMGLLDLRSPHFTHGAAPLVPQYPALQTHETMPVAPTGLLESMQAVHVAPSLAPPLFQKFALHVHDEAVIDPAGLVPEPHTLQIVVAPLESFHVFAGHGCVAGRQRKVLASHMKLA